MISLRIISCFLTLIFFSNLVSGQDRWSFPDSGDTGNSPQQPPPSRPTQPPPARPPVIPPSTPTQKPDLNPPNQPGITANIPVGCKCPYLQNHDPVCGSDGVTYANMKILECHKVCGKDVTYVRHGQCSGRG